MLRNLAKYCLRGILIVIPLLFIIYVIVNIYFFIKKLTPELHFGMIIVIMLITFTIIGYLFSHQLTHRFGNFIEKKLRRIPILHLGFTTIRKIFSSPVSKEILEKPVLITDEGTGERKIGFITTEDLNINGLEDHFAVFVPQAFGFGGETFLIHKNNINLIDTEGGKAYTLAITGGLSNSKKVNKKEV